MLVNGISATHFKTTKRFISSLELGERGVGSRPGGPALAVPALLMSQFNFSARAQPRMYQER